MNNKSVLMSVVFVILLIAIPAVAVVRYNITDLGTLDGYEASRAWSISDKGQIVGDVFTLGPPYTSRAVLFDATGDGNNIDLGTPSGDNSIALSVNNNGQIVGWAEKYDDPLNPYATIFDPNGGVNNTELDSESTAYSINGNGQIVGLITFHPDDGSDSVEHAALFDQHGGAHTDLGTLAGYARSEAYSINNSGAIVGFSYNDNYPSTGDYRAILFDPNGQGNNIDLGTLGGEVGFALSINNNKQIVGGGDTVSGDRHAILFDSTGDGNNIDLGTLGEGSAAAISINDSGQIVGQSWVDGPITPQYAAVLFDPTGDGNNIKLDDLIDPCLGWKLTSARCINNSGWIVGAGTNPDGHYRAFLLTPVIPSDFEHDKDVDFLDFAVLASAWRSRPGDNNWNPFCDISDPNDDIIDELDLLVFTNNWLKSTP